MTERLRRWASLGIWLVAAIAATFLWLETGHQRSLVVGVVEGKVHRVGPVEASKLRAVFVRAGERVKAGQPVAALETTDLDAEIALAHGRLDELLAEIEAQTESYGRDLRTRRVTLEAQLASAQANLAEARSKQAGEKAELSTLNRQLTRLQEMEQRGLAEMDRVSTLRTRHARLSRSAQHSPATLTAYRTLAVQTDAALEHVDDKGLEVLLKPVRARAQTQAQQLTELMARRQRRTLRAPRDGQVATVFRNVGDPLVSGEAVLEVVETRADRLLAYVPEQSARALGAGSVVQAASHDQSKRSLSRGVVEEVGESIVQIPARFWRAPNKPEFGRPVHIKLNENSDLLVGEAVLVTEISRGAIAAATATKTQEAQVPAALTSLSRLEVSGAVWWPARDRFLVVSDDTGHKKQGKHAPWLFTVSKEGIFDPDPVLIEGVDKVSDLESVTVSPSGDLYLLTSQSRNKRGRRPVHRQWFLRAKMDAAGIRVTGKIALASALESHFDLEERAALGLTDQLDIEGMAWHDGGLLLGLKAPVAEGIKARVWRLSKPDALFDGRGLGPAGAGLTTFGLFHLPTGPGDAPGGVSDLRVEGKTLYILSTLADGPAAGAAWRVDLDSEHMKPKLMTRWPGLKPEAISRSKAGPLIVFFDLGKRTPRLTRIDP